VYRSPTARSGSSDRFVPTRLPHESGVFRAALAAARRSASASAGLNTNDSGSRPSRKGPSTAWARGPSTIVRSIARNWFLCSLGRKSHTGGSFSSLGYRSMSDGRMLSNSPGRAPVSSWRSITAATCLLTNGRTASTRSCGTGATFLPSRAVVRPRFSASTVSSDW
jgi:hypothetical protein